MRIFSCRWIVMVLAVLGTALVHSEEIVANLDEKAPAEGVLLSFENGQDAASWGWYRNTSGLREIGQSFTASSDGKLKSLTLKVHNVRSDFTTDLEFTVRLYETQNISQNPDTGRLMSTQKGTLRLSKGHEGWYLTFELADPAPLREGGVYTFMLAWDTEAAFNTVSFVTNTGYPEGKRWFSEEAGSSNLQAVGRQSLVFYIQ